MNKSFERYLPISIHQKKHLSKKTGNDMAEEKQENKIQIVDRRRISPDLDKKEVPEYKRKLPTYLEHLQKQLSSKDEKLRERLDELKVENDAYKKRLQTEMEKQAESNMMRLSGSLLEVIDSFDRALETAKSEHSFEELMQGVNMIRSHFLNVLQKTGVTTLDVLNAPFDPDLAEAMGVIDIDDPKKNNMVIEEFAKGYKYKDKLLRPAMVRVGQFKKKVF